MELNIHCPKCHHPLHVPLSDANPGRTITCSECGETLTFAGQDAARLQSAVDNLTAQLGEGSVRVTVKTKPRCPWWKLWA